jgi:glyoxylase-like metal-dependent hydrolase (beta-lactamase superfamily II)
MAGKIMLSMAFAVLLAIPASAEDAAPDVKAVLAKADAAMGVSKVTSLQYSATGYVTALGQNYSSALDETWPRFELKGMTRTIDFPSHSMREDQTRVQGVWNATRGGGQRPIMGERKQHQLVSGDYAWNVNDQNTPAAAAGQAELRQLELLMTPIGFVKAAMAAPDAKVAVYTESSRNMRKSDVVSFKAFGKYPINGWIDDQGLVTKVQTWLPNPVLGDMFVETRLRGQYKDVGNGVKFPTGFHQSIGVPPHPSYDIQISDVKVNVADAALQVPDAVRQVSASPARVVTRQMGPGVWLLGGPYNSMAVEFKDYAVIVEGPMDIARGEAVIAETRRLIPNKPIRYVVNTHHHFDHSGGLRPFGAEDIVIITHESNFNYYEGVVFDLRPRSIAPDRLSMAPRQVHYVLVKEGFKLTDGEQEMDIYHADQLEHAEDMLFVYLPKLKIVYEADLYNPAPAGAAQPPVSAQNMNFLYNMERVGIAPETIVSTHTGVHPMSDFLKFMGVGKITARGEGLNQALNQ